MIPPQNVPFPINPERHTHLTSSVMLLYKQLAFVSQGLV